MPPGRPFYVRDPLYGGIHLTDIEKWILDSDIFQRQRGIKQMGTTLFVYPSGVQTRFVHALGNLQIIGAMFRSAIAQCPKAMRESFAHACRDWLALPAATTDNQVNDEIWQIVRVAGMCHDLGHFPMGHVLEYSLDDPNVELVRRVLGDDEAKAYEPARLAGTRLHEYATWKLLETNGAPGRSLFREDDDVSMRVKGKVTEIIRAPEQASLGLPVHRVAACLAGLVSGEIDADRAEYLRRDGYVSGAGHGQYDLERLLESYTIMRGEHDAFHMRPSSRALDVVETFLLERVRVYSHLYYHNIGVLFDALLVRVLRAVYVTAQFTEILKYCDTEGRRQLRAAVAQLPVERLHYRNFARTDGYLDDAVLWEFLRRLLGALERMSERFASRHIELSARCSRLLASLRILLRRRRQWVSVWKRPEQFRQVGNAAIKIAVEVTTPDVDEDSLRSALAARYGLDQKYAIAPSDLNILNMVAHYRDSELEELATELERRLNAARNPQDPRYFVELGHRAFFRPIKEPATYEIANEHNTPEALSALSPAAVRAIMGLWHENIHLRMFVLADREMEAGEREAVAFKARELLPMAFGQWYSTYPFRLAIKGRVPVASP